MADFCMQCSTELFGQDYQDLAYIGGHAPTLPPGDGYPVICEGCGPTLVDDAGRCISSYCDEAHNPQEE